MTNFENITTIDGVYDFLEGNLCSTLFSSDPDNFGYLNTYNRVMGAVRVRSQRYTGSQCTLKETESKFAVETDHTFPCWAGTSTEEYGPCTTLAGITSCEFRYHTAAENGDSGFGQTWHITTDKESYDGDGFTHDINVNMTSTAPEMKAFFTHLRTANFITKQTKAVFVEFVTFQPSLNQHMVVILIFEMTHGGIINPVIKTYPFKVFLIFVSHAHTHAHIHTHTFTYTYNTDTALDNSLITYNPFDAL